MPMSPHNVTDYTADKYINQKRDVFYKEAQKVNEAIKFKKSLVELEREKQQKAASGQKYGGLIGQISNSVHR